jgi:hypothetical protein
MVTANQVAEARQGLDIALTDMHQAEKEYEQNYFATLAVCQAIELAGLQIAHAIGERTLNDSRITKD